METKRVRDFLETYGVEVEHDEDEAYVELMMDDHKCVDVGVQYYIPDYTYSNADEEVYDYLIDNYIL